MAANCNILEQNRRNGLIFNIPPPRYTPTNPYEAGFTKEQLDMRRKAEILKYNKSANGRITKVQSWTQVVSGSTQRRAYSGAYLANVVDAACEQVVTYTTGAGIPGPAIPLYLDPAVPLYNYNTQTNGLGINNKEEDEMFRTKYNSGLLLNGPVIYTLNIRPTIDTTMYNFTVRTSVGIYLDGSANANPLFTANLRIESTSIKVLYGYETVVFMRQPIVRMESGAPVNIDVSGGLTGGPYAGAIYLGNIVISNLWLPTAAGNTYDIMIEPTITATIDGVPTNDPINQIRATFYSNLIPFSNDLTTLSNNSKRFGTRMTFSTVASASTVQAPSLTGSA